MYHYTAEHIPMQIPSNIKYSTRYPLGVFAMFISLAYAAMVVCLIVGIDKLKEPYERLPIIYFLILFPILVLCIFTYLFIKHNTKFHGPGDFRSDAAFIQMSGREIEEKNEKEKAELSEQLRQNDLFITTTSKKSSQAESQISVIQNAALKSENMSVGYLARILHIDFKRNVKFRLNGHTTELDGVGEGANGKYIVECKYYFKKPFNIQLQQTSTKLTRLSCELNREMIAHRLFLFVIIQNCDRQEIVQIKNYYKENNPGLAVYVMTYDELSGKHKQDNDRETPSDN